VLKRRAATIAWSAVAMAAMRAHSTRRAARPKGCALRRQVSGAAFWFSQEGTFVTEPIFVAKPDGAAEDDGVLISVIFDTTRGESGLSFVLILDPKDMSEIGRIELGYKLQAHYHGKFCKGYGDGACVGH
jgi:hypothetical protein